MPPRAVLPESRRCPTPRIPLLLTLLACLPSLALAEDFGVGGFAAKTDFPTGSGPTSVVIADMNLDLWLDLVLTDADDDAVTVPEPDTGTPTDSVRFFDGTTPIGTVPVSGGVAVWTGFETRRRERTFSAVYAGDGRLRASISPERTVRVISPTGVPGGGAAGLALEQVRPNPVPGGTIRVAFELPGDAPARLELLDVSGRRVCAREVGSLGPGRHALDLGAGIHLAPGVYLVRLAQGSQARVRRVVVLD